jgi:hypothetical protein
MIIWIIFIFIIIGCEKEKLVTEYVEKEYSWKEHSGIEHENKYILNSYSTTEELFLIGDRYFIRIDTENRARKSIFNQDIHNTKIPLSENILMIMYEENNETGLMVFYYIPEMNNWSSNSRAFVHIADVDSTFRKFDNFDETFNIPFASFNNSNQILIPYEGENGFQSFILITFNINPNANPISGEFFISTSEIKIVKLPINTSPHEIVTTNIEEDFIVSNSNIVAKIYSDGTYKILYLNAFSPWRFFEKDSKHYAVDYNEIYVSMDKGETWNNKYVSSERLDGYMFSVINDKIIMSKRSILLEMIFNEDGFVTEELKNDGLEGNFVTSISEFNSKVYISTFSGLFYKNLTDLFDKKEIEE